MRGAPRSNTGGDLWSDLTMPTISDSVLAAFSSPLRVSEFFYSHTTYELVLCSSQVLRDSGDPRPCEFYADEWPAMAARLFMITDDFHSSITKPLRRRTA
jgi:hypothetical protein